MKKPKEEKEVAVVEKKPKAPRAPKKPKAAKEAKEAKESEEKSESAPEVDAEGKSNRNNTDYFILFIILFIISFFRYFNVGNPIQKRKKKKSITTKAKKQGEIMRKIKTVRIFPIAPMGRYFRQAILEFKKDDENKNIVSKEALQYVSEVASETFISLINLCKILMKYNKIKTLSLATTRLVNNNFNHFFSPQLKFNYLKIGCAVV